MQTKGYKYKAFIEDNFLIDGPEESQLIPFKFRKVQNEYYQELCDDYDIENKGLSAPVREIIVKARKQGFSSLILGLFAADDILQENPTNTQVYSYKDDATSTFDKRYKVFIKSWYAKELNTGIEEVKDKDVFSECSAGKATLRHNKAEFSCQTASARTASRGSTVQKILFSESAHYPDTEKMTAKEIIEGTSAQMSIKSGWVFNESTANGTGNYHHKTWEKAVSGKGRYKARFFSWRRFYSQEEYELIKAQSTDKDMFKQEFPDKPEDAFLSTGLKFTESEKILRMQGIKATKHIISWENYSDNNYISQAEMIKHHLETFERTYGHYNLFVGIDVAKSVDETIVTIIRDNEKSISGGIKAIAIDSTGAGDFMPDWFDENTRWHILRVKFSRPMKNIMYKNLLAVIENKMTSIPELRDEDGMFIGKQEEDFYDQMVSLNKEIKSDLIVVSHPTGGHDDYPDSWALAEHAYVDYNGMPEAQKKEFSGKLENPLSKMLDLKKVRQQKYNSQQEEGFI